MSSGAPAPLPAAYVDAYNGYSAVALSAVFIPISAVCVALRFYCRFLKKTPLWLDDWLVLVALVVQIGFSAIVIAAVQYAGVGRHLAGIAETDPAKVTVYFKFLLVLSFYYFFSVPWAKLSILALYYRLFGNTGGKKVYRYSIFSIASIIIATWIVTCIFSLNLCKPFEYNWNHTIAGKCFDQQAFFLYGSLPNVVTDIAMLILPMPVVWNLNVNRKNKIAMTFVFISGSLGLAFSIVRFVFFIGNEALEDGTWNSVKLCVWTIVETYVYLITACLPIYRPLLSKILGGRMTQVGSSGQRTPNASSRFQNRAYSKKKFSKIDDVSREDSVDEEGIPLPQYAASGGSDDKWRNEIRVESDVTVTHSQEEKPSGYGTAV